MKTWRLVAGILSIVIFCIVMFQSCSVGVYNTLEKNNKDFGGIAGFTVGFLMLAGGITSIATRKESGKGGRIAIIILFGIAALLAFTNSKIYKDLILWGIWCAVNAIIALLFYKRNGKA